MYRINVSNWQDDSSVLQVIDGKIVLDSTGKAEDTFSSKIEAEKALASIPIGNTYELSIEEVANV